MNGGYNVERWWWLESECEAKQGVYVMYMLEGDAKYV